MPADPLPRSQEPSVGADAEDPLIDGLVERVLAPYRRLLSPAAQDELRELLQAVYATHPEVAPVVNRLRERRPSDCSGGRLKPGVSSDE